MFQKEVLPGLTGLVTPCAILATTVLTREHIPSSFQKTVIAAIPGQSYYTRSSVGILSFSGKQTVILFWTKVDPLPGFPAGNDSFDQKATFWAQKIHKYIVKEPKLFTVVTKILRNFANTG